MVAALELPHGWILSLRRLLLFRLGRLPNRLDDRPALQTQKNLELIVVDRLAAQAQKNFELIVDHWLRPTRIVSNRELGPARGVWVG
jgi:hypothetical protein